MKTAHLLGLTAAALLTATGASAADNKINGQNCFHSGEWSGWSVANDGDTIYLRINSRDIFQVDLAPKSHIRRDADDFLISKVHGTDWICAPIDLDLSLSDHSGFKEPIFVKSLHKLTPEEIAAIPKKELP